MMDAVPALLPGAFAIQLSSAWRTSAEAVWKLRQIAYQTFAEDGAVGQLGYLKIVGHNAPELHLVPYYLPSYLDYPILRTLSSIWQQFRVVMHTIFGSHLPSRPLPERIPAPPLTQTGQGALIDAAIIKRQLVWQSAHTNILYNYRPIETESRVHLLATVKPEAPARDFGELTSEQYGDVWNVAQRVHDRALELWPHRQVETHVYDKSGAFAGQTQPVYHAHIVVILDPSESTWSKLTLLFRMIWLPSPLNTEQLQQVIEQQRELFNRDK